MPLYCHFALRQRRAAIYTAITTTVAVRCSCKSLLFAVINSRQVTSLQSLVLCIPFPQAATTINTSGTCLHNNLYDKPVNLYKSTAACAIWKNNYHLGVILSLI